MQLESDRRASAPWVIAEHSETNNHITVAQLAFIGRASQ